MVGVLAACARPLPSHPLCESCDPAPAGMDAAQDGCAADCIADGAVATPAPAIVLDSDDIGVDLVAAMEVSADASRVYPLAQAQF